MHNVGGKKLYDHLDRNFSNGYTEQQPKPDLKKNPISGLVNDIKNGLYGAKPKFETYDKIFSQGL